MTQEEIHAHCAEIERCNQRGGRMLSIVDLIDAGTFSEDLAAYALAAINNGASFMVGALAGGAGKTTVMGALLNFVPKSVRLVPADGLAAMHAGTAETDGRRCFICHEIGPGPYYAYLWGEPLRAYFDLPAAGHLLATNLHADTLEQARKQVCGDNGVSEAAFRRMNLIFLLSAERSGFRIRRRIEQAWESDGSSRHRQVYSARCPSPPHVRSDLVSEEDAAQGRAIIDLLGVRGARTIEEVRAAIVEVT